MGELLIDRQIAKWRAEMKREFEKLDWRSMLLRPTLERRKEITGIPNDSGIYCMFAPDESLLYVGRSIRMASRLRQHQRRTYFHSAPVASYSYVMVPESLILGVEVAHIDALNPPENKFREAAAWIGHDEVVKELRSIWGITE